MLETETEKKERMLGVSIAERESLTKTAGVIKGGRCYEKIFKTLYNEAGEVKLLELVKESNNPKWAYYSACGIFDVSEDTIKALAQIVIKSNDPCWAYYFARNVLDISIDMKEALAEVVIKAEDSYEAYLFAYYVSDISNDTKEALARVVIKARDFCDAYLFAQNVFGISEDTREKLRAADELRRSTDSLLV